ncbi:MAG: xanthine dehydrogenase small subunit [Rhizobiales bacterium]|nr:xanthine dehydrogenase small subunit [Hyphomicrobiales bacterium]
MRRSIRFLLGEEWRDLSDVDPLTTALDWLRTVERRTGTKEGCAEGDCGACTILVGRMQAGRLVYEPVDSCIRLLATLDRCHVLTVEHLRRPDGRLHAIQRALVEAHATQCGFCTPGFVMSLAALWLDDPSPDEATIERALQGNLCRCTGYAPIVAAARAMSEDDEADRLRFARMRREAEDKLATIDASEPVTLRHGARVFHAPTTLEQLDALRLAHPEATLFAGATDVGLWITKQMRDLPTLVWLGGVEALRRIDETAGALELGATVSYRDARAPLVAAFPDMAELLDRIGGAQVRAMGTIGGNIANGSPIGDMPPALIALDATLVLRSQRGRRQMSLEDFFVAYGKQDRAGDEYVESLRIPRIAEGETFRAWKISKRRDEDISSVCGAFKLRRDATGAVAAARIAFGGMAATPKRARASEAALIGRPATRETFAAAAAALATDFAPIDDWRASAAYRMRVAQNLFERLRLDLAGAPTRLPAREAAHG